MAISLVTDRTQADVTEVAENPASTNTKGAYNYTDFNRLNEACLGLMEIMNECGYSVSGADYELFNTEKTMYDYPTESYASDWLNNVYSLIEEFYQRVTYTLPSDLSAFTYTQANNIEKALEVIQDTLADIKLYWDRYSDTMYVGGDAYGLRGYCL